MREIAPPSGLSPDAKYALWLEEMGLGGLERHQLDHLRKLVVAGLGQKAMELLRLFGGPKPSGDARAAHARDRQAPAVAGGSASERRIAKFLSRLVGEEAKSDPDVLEMRQSIALGGSDGSEPLARKEAWARLDAPGSDLAGNHHGGPLARLTLDAKGRGREAVRLKRSRGHHRGEVYVPKVGALWASVERLSLRYRWTPSQAATFLLFGETPIAAPVEARISRTTGVSVLGAEVTITARPETSPESVAATFAKAQRMLFGEGRRGRLPLKPEAVREFVNLETARNDGKRPPRRALWEKWNRLAPPSWRYDNVERFRNAQRGHPERPAAAPSRGARKRRPARDARR